MPRTGRLLTLFYPAGFESFYRELGEVTLQAAGADWHWTELPERVVLRLMSFADPDAVLVPLCAGVRELVVLVAGGSGGGRTRPSPVVAAPAANAGLNTQLDYLGRVVARARR